MRDKQSIQREIAKLGLPPIVSQIFEGTSSRLLLAFRCADPYNSLVDGLGFPDHLIPLWECGTTVTAFDPLDRVFCKVDLEAPEEPWFRVHDFNEVAADVLIDLWEDQIPDHDLAQLASQFGFKRLPQLVTALENGPRGDYDSWRAALRTNNSE